MGLGYASPLSPAADMPPHASWAMAVTEVLGPATDPCGDGFLAGSIARLRQTNNQGGRCPALAAEKYVGGNTDVRTVLAFKAADVAIQKLLPEGWEPDVTTSGPAKDINLRGKAAVEESWQFQAPDGNSIQLEIQYARGPLKPGKAESLLYSAVKPSFYRIYRYEQLEDAVRDTGTDRIQKIVFKASGPKLSPLFDGSEQLRDKPTCLGRN